MASFRGFDVHACEQGRRFISAWHGTWTKEGDGPCNVGKLNSPACGNTNVTMIHPVTARTACLPFERLVHSKSDLLKSALTLQANLGFYASSFLSGIKLLP